jgi:4-aminobutyrate aminotransferase
MLHVEIAGDDARQISARDIAERAMYEALSRGLSFKVTMGNVLSLAPPLTITQEEMGRALDILERSIDAGRLNAASDAPAPTT